MTISTMRRLLILAARTVVSAALLALVLLEANTVGYSKGIQALSPATIAAVIGIVLLQMAIISAWRLKLVMQLLGYRVSAVDAARVTWSGFFVEQIGAVLVAGDIARIWLLRRVNVTARAATEGVLFDRAVGFATLIAMASLGMPRLLWGLDSDDQRGLLLAVAVAGGGLTALLILAMLRYQAVRSLAELRGLGMSTVRTLTQASRPRVVAVVLLALSTHGLNVIAIYMLLNAVGIELGLATCFVFTPTVLLVSMLPASVSGWGVREGALILALRTFGAPAGHVLMASVLFGLCVLISSLPGAIIWLSIPDRRNASPERFQNPTPIADVIKLPQ